MNQRFCVPGWPVILPSIEIRLLSLTAQARLTQSWTSAESRRRKGSIIATSGGIGARGSSGRQGPQVARSLATDVHRFRVVSSTLPGWFWNSVTAPSSHQPRKSRKSPWSASDRVNGNPPSAASPR